MNNTIPSADDVKGGNSRPNYRFSNGQLCCGREEDGSLQVAKLIVGELRRVGIHRGVLDTGEDYGKLEIDIETSEGIVHVGANLGKGHASVSSITFGEGLLAVEKDELIAIDAGRSKEKNRFGSYTTYANVYRVDPKTLVKTPARKRVGSKDRPMDETFAEIEELLADHSAWAPRPKRDVEGETGEDSSQGLLANEVRVKGIWPDTEKYEKEYLKVCQRMDDEDRPFTAWAQVPEEIVLELIVKHRAGKVIGPLKDLPKATNASAEEEYDPFEDE